MTTSKKSLVYLTAGAAGMYCGSCMQDNTLARGLTQIGVDVQLIPTYTPIRTDEENVSIDRVFFGGISVFLEQKYSAYRWLSPWLGPLLDQPWLIRWATRSASAIDPALLGALTVSMLRGEHGRQRQEVQKLCGWLASSVQPDLLQFSNILIGGCIPSVKAQLDIPVVVTLQGDDVFLESLPEPYRSQALQEIQRLVSSVDGFLVHSHYYAEFMSDYLRIPPTKIHCVPLGIDTSDFPEQPPKTSLGTPPVIGYMARLAPEKGFHLLVDAFIELRKREEFADAQLRAAGWLDPQKHDYLEEQREKLRAADLEDSFTYIGSVDRSEKVAFLRELDVLSVPTTYREPKGLFVLEALASGIPVVQPAHGAFPEMLEELGCGILVRPEDPVALAEGLGSLLRDFKKQQLLAERGRAVVLERHDSKVAAQLTWDTLKQFLR